MFENTWRENNYSAALARAFQTPSDLKENGMQETNSQVSNDSRERCPVSKTLAFGITGKLMSSVIT